MFKSLKTVIKASTDNCPKILFSKICSIFSVNYIDKITGKGEKRSVPKKKVNSRSKDLYLHKEGACVSKNLRRTFWKTGKLDPAREAEEMDSFSSKTSDSPHL